MIELHNKINSDANTPFNTNRTDRKSLNNMISDNSILVSPDKEYHLITLNNTL